MDKSTVKLRRNSSLRAQGPKALMDARRRSTSAITNVPMDRESMLIVEANEISECLKKHYVFSKENNESDNQAVVKVTNTMLGLSCKWTIDKLRERLVSMRKLMYSADTDKSTMAGESVFFDPNDTWIKDKPELDIQILESPRVRSRPTTPSKNVQNGHHKPLPRDRPSTPQETARPVSRGSSVPRDLMGNVVRGQNEENPRGETPGANSHPRVCEVYPTVKNKGEVPDDACKSSPNRFDPNDHRPLPASTSPYQASSTSPAVQQKRSSLRRSASPVLTVSPSQRSRSPKSNARSASPSSTSLPPSLKNSPVQSTSSLRLSTQKTWHTENENNLESEGRHSPVGQSAMTDTSVQTDRELRSSPVVRLALDMVKLVRDRLRHGDQDSESLMDRILSNCEALKVVVVNILEGFTQVQDSGDDIACFNDSDLMKTSSMQLISALELLVSNTKQLHRDIDTDVTTTIYKKIATLRNDLATELVILLHECQNASENGVQESCSRVSDLVYDMAHHCGRLYMSLAEPCPLTLQDRHPSSIQDFMCTDSDVDILNKYADTDIKQSFSSGCDVVVKLAFDEAQKEIHTSERSLLVLAEASPKSVEDIVIHSHRITGASRCMVKLIQKLQSEVGHKLLEDTARPKDFYFYYYNRDLELISKVNTLVSGLTMLSQATKSLVQDEDQGSFRRLLRCAEIVQNAVLKLAQASNCDTDLREAQSSPHNSPSHSNTRSSVLAKTQADKLQSSANGITSSTEVLISRVKEHVTDDVTQQTKSRRMLPAPPHGNNLVRCHSARSLDKHKLTKHRSLADIRSNEA